MPQPTIIFRVVDGLDNQKEKELIDRIASLSGVERVHPMNKHSSRDRIRRTYYSQVTDDSSAEPVLRGISDEIEVEVAEMPAARALNQ